MSRPHPRLEAPRMAAAGTGVVLALTLLAGCSGDDEPTSDETGAPSPGGESATTGDASASADPSSISPDNLPTAPTMRRTEGAVADVDIESCGTEPGPQEVVGTVTNTAERTRDFVITLSWTNDRFDVLGRGVAVVRDLPAGERTEWSVTAEVPDGVTLCTPNVLRGNLPT